MYTHKYIHAYENGKKDTLVRVAHTIHPTERFIYLFYRPVLDVVGGPLRTVPDARATALKHGAAANMLSPARGEVGGRRPSKSATSLVVTRSCKHVSLRVCAAEYLLLHMVLENVTAPS